MRTKPDFVPSVVIGDLLADVGILAHSRLELGDHRDCVVTLVAAEFQSNFSNTMRPQISLTILSMTDMAADDAELS